MKWMLDDADPEARDNGDLIATARSKDGRLLPIYLASLPRTPGDHDD